MILKLKRTPGIYLVGFMGSGKSSVGRDLAWELGWSFFDIDREIEAQQGTTIASIFDSKGEAEFRKIEIEAIRVHVKLVERGKPCVIALGGGAFVQPATFELLENNGITIWLDCPFELVRARVGGDPSRPLARDPQQLEKLYEQRRPTYAKADYRIEASGDDPAAVVLSIMKLPIF